MSNPTAPARKPPLPALTGIRTVLALNIVLFHFMPPPVWPFYPFAQNGFVFVGFFFLLSGFVLAYNYDERSLTLNPRAFWLARFARLYPIYLLALFVSFQMLQLEWRVRSHAEFLQGLLFTPLLLQAWHPKLATFWNTVGWTLSCELLLYGAFPWILRIWARRLGWLNTPRRLIALFLALWIAGMVPHALYLLLNPDHLPAPPDRYSYGFWLRALKYTPLAYLCMFLAGITLGKLQLQLRLTHRQRFVIAAVGLVLIVTLFYTVVGRIPYILLHGGLLLPLFAVLTIGLCGDHAISSAFSVRPLLAIGETTFCVYMLHFNTINLFNNIHLWSRLHLEAFDPWISYVAVLILAYIAHHVVENPARRFLLNRFSARPKPAPQAVPAG
ncbi:MAG TPA: acyltransferase [Granulicella sp.]